MERDPRIRDVDLDRLVDGELTVEEEQRLLASLDQAPDGWRRCALAFVEAQAWRRELIPAGECAAWDRVALASGEVSSPRAMIVQAAGPANGRRAFWGYATLAAAASVLVAFSLGLLVPREWLASGAGSQRQEPDSTNPASGIGAEEGALEWPDLIDPAHVVTLIVPETDGSARPIFVPLLGEEDVRRLASGMTENGVRSALPGPVRRQLEEAGYRIDQRRRYAPVPLAGGQRMIVPIEDTRIVPMPYRVY